MSENNKVNSNVHEKMEELMAKKKPKQKKQNSKARELGTFWIKNSIKFIKELESPSTLQYKQMLRLYATGALFVGVFCYGIKVIHIPINNMFVGK
ncbi:hypothetical protein EHP00_1147 [Ecytonucleospora hepatopenaei]|uniref:Uncharacterized protein n=1 Tax=Ecytonucleospora hepatopenaei TaxID=646526 RepID=A0A1W0E4I1_9MICR|nr:hypothetical protein EHP00_1147 [Ecytonucleospora hepatopenaei]